MYYGHVWGVLSFFVGVIGTLVVVVIAAGLIFLLVRFLLVATTAAKIYVAKNTPEKVEPAVTEPDAATVAEPAAPTVAEPAAPTVAEPAAQTAVRTTKPRTPKAPPAV